MYLKGNNLRLLQGLGGGLDFNSKFMECRKWAELVWTRRASVRLRNGGVISIGGELGGIGSNSNLDLPGVRPGTVLIARAPTSELGQKATSARRRGMSAPLPIADNAGLHVQVRSVPDSDIASDAIRSPRQRG